MAEDFQAPRSPSQVTRHLEISAQISSAAHTQKVQSSLGKPDSTCTYHFQAPTCADTESPGRNATAPALLLLKCDISTASALLPVPVGTGKHELHSYSSAPFNQPVTIFVLTKPCLKSTEKHRLSSSSETVSSPHLQEAVAPRTAADGGGQGQSTARVPLLIRSLAALAARQNSCCRPRAAHKTALTPDKFIIRLLLHGADPWFKLLSEHIALKPSGSQKSDHCGSVSYRFIPSSVPYAFKTNLAPSALCGQWRYRVWLCKSRDLSPGLSTRAFPSLWLWVAQQATPPERAVSLQRRS